MFSFSVRMNSLDVRTVLRKVRTNQFISTGDLYKLSLDGACRERKFSVQSRPRCYEMSDIAIATAPLTLHQTMLNKTNKLNGKDKSDVSQTLKEKEVNWVSFYPDVLKRKDDKKYFTRHVP